MTEKHLDEIRAQVRAAAEEVIEQAVNSRPGDIFVLGCSSSEVVGAQIGKGSNEEIAYAIVDELSEICHQHSFYLAVQGCEHINRALSIEAEAADVYELEEVNVVPALHAGGAASVAAWELFEHPVCVEFIEATLGMDIGDTEIGMHIRHVQRPLRLEQKYVGKARVTALMYRPKLIGGSRAQHR